MASWQTHVVCAYLRATRKKRYRTVEAGRRSMAHALPAAAPPEQLGDRLSEEPLGAGRLVTVGPAGGAVADAGGDAASVDGGRADAGGGAASVDGGRADAGGDAASVDGGRADAGGGALVYLHGGAFVNGIMPQHWQLVTHLADTTGRPVHVARYPLAPAHDVGDAWTFLDALHERLAPQVPLHVLGDSAGGTLALLYAQAHRGDDTVAGLTLIAPWLDLSMGNPAVDLVEPHDPWLTRAGMRPIASHWVAGRELTDPQVSPLFGDLAGLPPTLVLVGSRDICRPDCDRLVELAPDSADLVLQVEPGSPHDYPLLPTPEGARARDEITAHVRRTLDRP